jgi:hypothetical protein
MTPDDDTNLTMDKLCRAILAVLESRAVSDDFWVRAMATHGVQQVRFRRHLAEDPSQRFESRHTYGCEPPARILAAIPWLGQPATLILPEVWRRHLPPLPRLLNGEEP